MKKAILIPIFLMLSIIACLGVLSACNSDLESSVTTEHELTELGDDFYGYYTVVSSSIPAQNYEMITLYVDGQVRTYKGHVHIYYSDEEPRLILEDKNYINADVMTIYVPNDSIKFMPNTTIS